MLLFAILESDLPKPSQQVELTVDGNIYRPDFSYERERIIIEFDGVKKYSEYGPAQQVVVAERSREKLIQNQGWIVLRFNWHQVRKQPAEVMRTIATTLSRQRQMLGI